MSDKIVYTYNSRDEGYCVEGPGDGLGYHSIVLWPENWFSDIENVQRAQRIANIAYEEGYKQAQFDMRKSMGLTS